MVGTFSYIVTRMDVSGTAKRVYGTYSSSDGATGGVIETQLRSLENFIITPIATAVVSDVSVLNGTLEVAGGKKIIALNTPQGNVTIVTPANQSGFWTAYGV